MSKGLIRWAPRYIVYDAADYNIHPQGLLGPVGHDEQVCTRQTVCHNQILSVSREISRNHLPSFYVYLPRRLFLGSLTWQPWKCFSARSVMILEKSRSRDRKPGVLAR